MSGKTLLARIMGSTAAVAPATLAVAAGSANLSAEDQAAGTSALEGHVERAHALGMTEGRAAERERYGAVLTDADCNGHTLGLAITLLSTTENTVEQIKSACAAVPAPAATAPSAPAAAAPASPGQQQAADPLKQGGDPIEAATPLVDTGAPAGNADTGAADATATANLWKGAINSVAGGGASSDAWAGVFGAQRPN